MSLAAARDYPLLLGTLSACAVLVLVGRLIAELFRWLERLVSAPVLSPQPAPTPWRRTARKIWVVLALALLLVPLALAIAGLSVNPGAATKMDTQATNKPPSAEHPWGTDNLGRDLQVRVWRGGLLTLGIAALVAVIALLPSLLGGALTGWLASLRTWWSESLADLLLLPADALLFIPAVPGAIVIMLLTIVSRSKSIWVGATAVALVVLLPRAVRVYQMLWKAAPGQRKGLALGLAGTGIAFLGLLFAGWGLVAALDFMGLGFINPPNPALGSMLSAATISMRIRPEGLLASGIALWACALAFYTAADALVGFFSSKEALVRLNE
jgi:ABC-type dipeptide/oligopeptide/nickel transport system permease subunit